MTKITVEISPLTANKLQEPAETLRVTLGLIDQVVDALHDNQIPSGSEPPETIDPDCPPDMTHTKIIAATINNDPVKKPKWSLLLDLLLIRAMRQCRNFDTVQRVCSANMENGRNIDDGFRHLPEIDISVQHTSANNSCTAIVETAKHFGISLDIKFVWRKNKKCAYPGKQSRLQI